MVGVGPGFFPVPITGGTPVFTGRTGAVLGGSGAALDVGAAVGAAPAVLVGSAATTGAGSLVGAAVTGGGGAVSMGLGAAVGCVACVVAGGCEDVPLMKKIARPPPPTSAIAAAVIAPTASPERGGFGAICPDCEAFPHELPVCGVAGVGVPGAPGGLWYPFAGCAPDAELTAHDGWL